MLQSKKSGQTAATTFVKKHICLLIIWWWWFLCFSCCTRKHQAKKDRWGCVCKPINTLYTRLVEGILLWISFQTNPPCATKTGDLYCRHFIVSQCRSHRRRCLWRFSVVQVMIVQGVLNLVQLDLKMFFSPQFWLSGGESQVFNLARYLTRHLTVHFQTLWQDSQKKLKTTEIAYDEMHKHKHWSTCI